MASNTITGEDRLLSAAYHKRIRNGGKSKLVQLLLAFVLFDQLVLPMFHVGTIPFKLSYFALVFLLFRPPSVTVDSSNASVELPHVQREAVFSFACLIVFSILGQLTYTLWYPFSNDDVIEFGRSILIYVLMLCAFHVGVTHKQLNAGHLLYIFIAYACLHFVLSFWSEHVPWLASVYRTDEINVRAGILGFQINPNGAMLMMNMIIIGLYLGYKWKRGTQYSVPVYLVVLGVSAVIGMQLGSRNAAVAWGIITLAFLFEMYKRVSVKAIPSLVGCAIIMVCSAVGVSALHPEWLAPENTRLYKRVVEIGVDADEVKERPFLHYVEAFERALQSPLWGTGFVSCNEYPFQHSPRSYHNDWLRIVVSSGLLGVVTMLWIIYRFSMPTGWIMALPFVLPGLTNTFVLNIPAAVVYFLYAGAFYPWSGTSTHVVRQRRALQRGVCDVVCEESGPRECAVTLCQDSPI